MDVTSFSPYVCLFCLNLSKQLVGGRKQVETVLNSSLIYKCFPSCLAPEPEKPRTPMSPEPKLLSLLSASECHLAALQDEDGDT